MKTEKLRVSLAFGRGSDHRVEETAGAVHKNLYTQEFFDAPPVTASVLQAATVAFTTAMAAQVQGGTAATAEKWNRRTELVNLLEELAFYVQVKSANDLAHLLSSGFEAVRPTHAQTELPTPSTVQIKNGNSGEALVSTGRLKNARCYEVSVALVDDSGIPGEWTQGGIFTRSRNMRVTDLIPGRVYAYQLRAIGGLTGFSGWSDVVMHRAS